MIESLLNLGPQETLCSVGNQTPSISGSPPDPHSLSILRVLKVQSTPSLSESLGVQMPPVTCTTKRTRVPGEKEQEGPWGWHTHCHTRCDSEMKLLCPNHVRALSPGVVSHLRMSTQESSTGLKCTWRALFGKLRSGSDFGSWPVVDSVPGYVHWVGRRRVGRWVVLLHDPQTREQMKTWVDSQTKRKSLPYFVQLPLQCRILDIQNTPFYQERVLEWPLWLKTRSTGRNYPLVSLSISESSSPKSLGPGPTSDIGRPLENKVGRGGVSRRHHFHSPWVDPSRHRASEDTTAECLH